jgi:hypothetical protein
MAYCDETGQALAAILRPGKIRRAQTPRNAQQHPPTRLPTDPKSAATATTSPPPRSVTSQRLLRDPGRCGGCRRRAADDAQRRGHGDDGSRKATSARGGRSRRSTPTPTAGGDGGRGGAQRDHARGLPRASGRRARGRRGAGMTFADALDPSRRERRTAADPQRPGSRGRLRPHADPLWRVARLERFPRLRKILDRPGLPQRRRGAAARDRLRS